MATCAILGQALGTAVSQALQDGCQVENVDISKLQQTLMEDDCYIPWHTRTLPALTLEADCSAPVVRNGIDRGEENCWVGGEGDTVEYRFDGERDVREIRLVFDNDMNRKYHNMPCNYPLVQKKFKLPRTLIRAYRIEGIDDEGRKFTLYVENNHQRFVKHRVEWRVSSLRFVPLATHGCEEFRLFDFEIR
jgi:hypothetical protein